MTGAKSVCVIWWEKIY